MSWPPCGENNHPMTRTHSDFMSYLRVLRRFWWLVALVTIVTLASAVLVTSLQKPVYRSSMKVVVGQGGGVFTPQFGSTVDPFTATMSNLLRSEVVASTVIRRLGLSTTPTALLKHLGVVTKPSSSVLEVSFSSGNGPLATSILRQIGIVFTTLVRRKLAAPSKGTQPITATVFDDAHLEPGQISPRPVRSLSIAGVLGLGLGLLLAFAAGSLDTRIRSREEAEEWFGAPVIGTLPKGFRGRRSLAIVTGGSGRADSQRQIDALLLLRANLEFSTVLSGTTLLVTSAHPEEGKSTVTANLAVALASSGKDVICVEADLRRPRLMHYLDMPSSGSGLAEVVEKRVDLRSALKDVPLPASTFSSHKIPAILRPELRGDEPRKAGRLRVLMGGTPQRDPGDLLTAERVEGVVEELSAYADYVLFDAPPILLVGDAFPLARAADGVIIVARGSSTRRASAEAVRTTMHALAVDNVGVVLTDWAENDGYAYGYGYSSNGTGRESNGRDTGRASARARAERKR